MYRSMMKLPRAGFLALATVASLFSAQIQAAVTGITGSGAATSFSLTASAEYISQPDGASIYSWGYGCSTGYVATFLPAGIPNANCPLMQLPGPTMIVTEGQTVTVTLTNALPAAAGNTSIVFPGFQVTTVGGIDGLLTKEAAAGTPVSYTFTATKAGTYSYYSGTQAEVQVPMGLYGAIVVLPSAAPVTCTSANTMSLATAAYNHVGACYDREYLLQLGEIDIRLNNAVEAQVQACPVAPCPLLSVSTEPYQPQYFLINGRSLPDDLDVPYSSGFAHQPYNANPHMYPGELMLIRLIGQGRYPHPFHIHGNHARVLAYDGNLITAKSDITKLAGPQLFTLTTTPGQSLDAVFTWTGQGLNWDVYGRTTPHTCNGVALDAANPNNPAQQTAGFDPTTHEYCPDHGKAIPVTLPDPAVVASGEWYGGSPYLGLQTVNATPLPPNAAQQNPGAGYAFPWHSHHEREITTNNVYPGGMMTLMIIDPPGTPIDETK